MSASFIDLPLAQLRNRASDLQLEQFSLKDGVIVNSAFRLGSTLSAEWEAHPKTLLCYVSLSLLLTYTVGICVYNKYFHPLARYPGPFLGALTGWYLVYVIGSVPTFGHELHKKYGNSSLCFISVLFNYVADL